MSDIQKVNTDIQTAVKELEADFKAEIDAIRQSGAEAIGRVTDDMPDPNNFEAIVGLEFDVKWKRKTLKFDLPEFYSEREVIKFDVPEVRMETDEIKFDVPTTKRERKCVAKKPEFYMDGFKMKVKWTCIYMDVPKIYRKRVVIKLDVPKFNSKRIDVKFDKPVVKMKRHEIKLDVPQFYIKEWKVEIREKQKQVESIGQEMQLKIESAKERFKARLQTELAKVIDIGFDEVRAGTMASRDDIVESYEKAIAGSKSAIKTLKPQGAANEVKKLENRLSEHVNAYDATTKEIDGRISRLGAVEEEAINGLAVVEE
ncbi:MAG: hypothetical protein AAGB29_06595 [Planctomycetota bacterium]